MRSLCAHSCLTCGSNASAVASRASNFALELVFEHIRKQSVSRAVQPVEQSPHRQLLCAVNGIALAPCPSERFGGKGGTTANKVGIRCLFKPVLLKIVSQVESVIGQLLPIV